MKKILAIISVVLLMNGCVLVKLDTSTDKEKNQSSIKKINYSSNQNESLALIDKRLKKLNINTKKEILKSSKKEELLLINTSKYIYFNTSQYKVKNKNKLINFLKLIYKNNSLSLYIVGHTDSKGIDKSNQLLSEMRAREVYNNLVSLGYPKSRIDYIGYGEEQPIATNSTKKGRAKNRRVELFISSKLSISRKFIKNRIVNSKYLNNHNKKNIGKVIISTKGLTKNKSEEELKILNKKVNISHRKPFNVSIMKRKHFINTH